MLVLPPETSEATPTTEEVTQDDDAEVDKKKQIEEQEQKLQKEEECVIYLGMLSDEEESNTETDTDDSSYLFMIKRTLLGQFLKRIKIYTLILGMSILWQLLVSNCPRYTGDDSSHFTGPGKPGWGKSI